jgi:hypothetical protein
MLPFLAAMFLSVTATLLSTTENIHMRELEFAVGNGKLSVADRNIAVGDQNIPLHDSKIRPVKPRCRGHE